MISLGSFNTYELENNISNSSKRVVVFYCDWFDPSCRVTIVDPKYGMVGICMDKRFFFISN